MTHVTISDDLIRSAIACTKLPDAESVVEKALQSYIFQMKTKAELLQEYSEDWPWGGELSVPMMDGVLE